MAVEAVVSVVIRALTNLITMESETFGKDSYDIQEVLEKLRRLNNAQPQENRNNELQFLGNIYRLADAIESFTIPETNMKRMSFVNKLCREVPYEMRTYKNISRLYSEMNKVGNEIQIWEDGMRRHEQPWQESDAYYAPRKEKTIFKKDQKTLLKQLTSNSKVLQIISVFGDDGIGKTTHVKEIYKNLVANKKFASSALVVVNTKWSVRHLLMAILQQVSGLKVKEKRNDEVLRGRLHGFLKGQKYLIVFIDVKSRELLEDLRGALPDAYNGSRVLITTSNIEAASFADKSSRYQFQPLDMEEGLKFFLSKTWGKRNIPFSPVVLDDLKNRIANICKGTLMRIELLAGLLSTRGEIYEEWSRVFEQLDIATKSPSFDMVVFCFNDVPMHLKPCLLYLTLFPKGFEIPVRRLFRLWLAEGFVKPLRGLASEDIMKGYLVELVKRNLVQITERRPDESPKKLRQIEALQNILLPMALEISLFHLHQNLDGHSNTTAEQRLGIRRVVEYSSDIKMHYTSKAFNNNIQSYISVSDGRKDMSSQVRRFLKRVIGVGGFGLLKVLDLEGVYLPRLPENVGNLYHLRYLGLRSTFLDTLPASVGGLLYLETLDIKHTRITTLPSSIWNMKRLYHLCLNGARLDISEQSTVRRGPSQLETLWGVYVDVQMARRIGSTLSRMTNLRKLDITRQASSTVTTTTTTTPQTTTTMITIHSTSYEEIGSWISSLLSLQSLRLRSRDNMGQPAELIIKPLSRLENLSQLYLLGHLRESLSWYQIPPGLKVLTLSVSRLSNDPMPTLSQLPNLKVLVLRAASYVGEEMHCPENGFPALQILKLWKLEVLKLLTVQEGAMHSLHTMDIRCCINLKELPISLLQIQSFKKMILTNMPEEFVSVVRRKKKKHTKIEVNNV